MSGSWIATYRLQLHAGFPLSAARQVLGYLAELGISHVYLSPCMQAVPGSQHGYDVVDPGRISDDLGGEAAWSDFVRAARELGLRILLDIVPNHMSASHYNPWWDDVLRQGPFSPFANYFDIRIPPGQPFCVHLCSLGKPYGEALEAGELRIEVVGNEPRVKHYENTWPLSPASWGRLLGEGAERCFDELDRLRCVADPGEEERCAYRRLAARARDVLAAAAESGRLQDAVARLQGGNEIDAILRRQFYLLHGWKLSGELTNYRRFFDIDSLIGVRTERPDVTAATHARVAEMIARGEIDGVRVDHPDGLREPVGSSRVDLQACKLEYSIVSPK